jgi:hypothetical protein
MTSKLSDLTCTGFKMDLLGYLFSSWLLIEKVSLKIKFKEDAKCRITIKKLSNPFTANILDEKREKDE